MSDYVDVLVDLEPTTTNRNVLYNVTEEQAKNLVSLGETNDELMSFWYGKGGNSFQRLASTIEGFAVDGIRFTSNAEQGLGNLIVNFQAEDATRSNSIGSTGSGSGSGDDSEGGN